MIITNIRTKVIFGELKYPVVQNMCVSVVMYLNFYQIANKGQHFVYWFWKTAISNIIYYFSDKSKLCAIIPNHPIIVSSRRMSTMIIFNF